MGKPDKRVLYGLLLGAVGALAITAMGAGPAPSATGGKPVVVPITAAGYEAPAGAVTVSFERDLDHFRAVSDGPSIARKGRSSGSGTTSPDRSLAVYEG